MILCLSSGRAVVFNRLNYPCFFLSLISEPLRRGPRRDPNRFECEKCGRVYASSGNLSRHLRYECGIEANLKCPFCPYKGKYQVTVNKHVVAKHAKEKGFQTWRRSCSSEEGSNGLEKKTKRTK